MQSLDATDLGRLARFLGEVGVVEGEAAFPPEFLAALRRLVPCDAVCFSELDRLRQRELGFLEEPVYEGPEPDVSYWDIRHEHPVCSHQDRTGDFRARKISDFLGRRELRRSRIYAEWFRPWGVEHELCVGLDAPFTHTKVFVFDRTGGRDFDERDRGVLDAVRPMLAERYSAMETRARLRDVLSLLGQADASVVLLEGRHRIAFATEPAKALLERYFGRVDDRLPEPVARWLFDGSGEPLSVGDGDRSLVIRAAGGALLLEERATMPALTPREREILELVAEGLTNGEIAERLWLSPGTVRRHLENVFEKLGVHTRTAAAAFVSQERRA